MIDRFAGATPSATRSIMTPSLERGSMRVFVYEFTCSGRRGLAGPIACAEGGAMLAAALHDLAGVPGVETVTLLAADLPSCPAPRIASPAPTRNAPSLSDSPPRRRLAWSSPQSSTACSLSAAAGRWRPAGACSARRRGGRTDGGQAAAEPPPAAHGIPTPPGNHPADGSLDARAHFPRGPQTAGRRQRSQATCLVRTRADLADCLVRMRAEMPRAELLLQPFVAGQPVSVALLLGPGQEVRAGPGETAPDAKTAASATWAGRSRCPPNWGTGRAWTGGPCGRCPRHAGLCRRRSHAGRPTAPRTSSKSTRV